MMFCSKCGTILLSVQKEGKILQKCSKCEYEMEKKRKSFYKIKKREDKVVVIGKQAQKIRTLPTVKTECSRCGNMEAEYWMVQTRSADESMTQFFRCTRCQHTWREIP